MKTLVGHEVREHLGDLARLRIAVFREYPYLYDGHLDYEARYLEVYAAAPESLFVLVFAGGSVVGASTGVPMKHEDDAFKRPFVEHGFAPEKVFYFGESVLLPEYRGRGLGKRFFVEREGYARRLGRFSWCAFCAVERPENHPLRPAGYRPLDELWTRQGYVKEPRLHTTFSWKELGEAAESPKPMTFWLKSMDGDK